MGLRISPKQQGKVKIGFQLQVQRSESEYSGQYQWFNFSDATDNYYINGPLGGTEKLSLTRIDAFFGASRATGVLRPYGGFYLSNISGSNEFSAVGSSSVWVYPKSGGMGINSTESVSIDYKTDVDAVDMFGGVVGLSINPDANLGMNIEAQYGIQTAIFFSGSIRF